MGLLYVDHTFVPTNSITGLARLRQLFVLHVLQEAWALEEEIIQDARGLALSGWELQITEGCSSKRVVYSGIQVELAEVRETTKQWKRDGNTVMMTSCIPVSFVGNCLSISRLRVTLSVLSSPIGHEAHASSIPLEVGFCHWSHHSPNGGAAQLAR